LSGAPRNVRVGHPPWVLIKSEGQSMTDRQSWADRFRWSQKKWAQKYDAKAEAAAAAAKPGQWIGTCLSFATVTEMMDDLHGGYFALNSKEPDLFRAGCTSFLISYLEHGLREDLTGPIFRCESPIEIAMGFALYLVAKELRSREAVLRNPIWEEYVPLSKLNVLLIEPQKPIGDHRVDFLLTYRGNDRESFGKPRDQWKDRPFHSQLIVECDGHDFHEKSKEQAARDKKRDRALQDLGFKVFHFTGHQIWNDVFGCAQEAVGSLLKDARRQIKG